ncbi:hypothetical protein AB6A23_08735 [Paenibacillus tarimensis]
MLETIEPVGFESSKRIGKLKFQTNSIMVIFQDEEINLTLTYKNRNEYYYLDFIENTINSFKFVCHIVKSDGIEKDVIATLFLRDEKDLDFLRGYLKKLNKHNKELRTSRINNKKERTFEVQRGKGWLSRRRE